MRDRVYKKFNNFKSIGDIKSISDINALEIVENKKTKELFDSYKRVGYEIYKTTLKKGFILRPLGHVLYFNPPLNIKKEEFGEALRLCKFSIEKVLGNQE